MQTQKGLARLLRIRGVPETGSVTKDPDHEVVPQLIEKLTEHKGEL